MHSGMPRNGGLLARSLGQVRERAWTESQISADSAASRACFWPERTVPSTTKCSGRGARQTRIYIR